MKGLLLAILWFVFVFIFVSLEIAVKFAIISLPFFAIYFICVNL